MCLLGAANETASSLSYNFKQISYEQGLPGINLRDQIQDKHGIMWICIESIGLCQYDGHKFELYQHQSNDSTSISSNFVNKVVEDHAGLLWIATDNGLNSYNKHTNKFTRYFNDDTDPASIPSNICRSLFVDSRGHVWVGTENGLAVKESENGGFKRFLWKSDTTMTNNLLSILSFEEQSNGIFWLGSSEGLIKFDPVTGQFRMWNDAVNKNNAPIHMRILDLLPDGDFLWLATHRGLDRFNLKTETFERWYFHPHDQYHLENQGINALMKDQHGNIWVGTYTRGLLIIDKETQDYQRITRESKTDYPLKSDHIRYIYQDRQGMIWIGTKFEGVFKYNENVNVFNHWPKEYLSLLPLKYTFLLSFFEDQTGDMWLGSKLDGLYHVDKQTGEITNYQHQVNNPKTLSSNRIQAILMDSENRIWIGTEAGLNLMINDQFITCSNRQINALFEDKTGSIWVGTLNGLFKIDEEKQKLIRHEPDENVHFFQNDQLEIMQIFEDHKATLWFSTRFNGLHSYQYETGDYRHLQHSGENQPFEISDNMTRAIHEDHQGRLWIGTKSQGINLLDRKSGQSLQYTMKDGLPSNMILCIEEDNDGHLWLGTHSGISRFDTQNYTFTNYNSDYGLQSNISEINASFKLNTGDLLFGGNNGFNVFSPGKIKKNKNIAPLLITSIKIDNQRIKSYLNQTEYIDIRYKENLISFEFTLTDYNNPYRHQYAVMLSGIDKDWQMLGNRNFVSYSNLPPGKYQFKLRGANEFGSWSDPAVSVNLKVLTPAYQQLWFKVLAFLLFIFFVILAIYQMKRRQTTLERLINERTKKLEVAYKELLNKNSRIRQQNRQIEQHHNELEQKVAERTRDLELAKQKAEEADRLKSSFLANMSHEIRTPLNAITGFSALVSSDMYSSERKNRYVELIKANTSALLKLVEDLLDISRIEAGQLKIDKEPFDFSEMIQEVFLQYKEEIEKKNEEKGVSLSLSNLLPQGTVLIINSDKLRIKQVLNNLLNNAIKFTSKGYIEIGYRIEEKKVIIWVSDSGIGIHQNDLESIFNRFTKIENQSKTYRGTGLGLSISKSLVNMLGGNIWVESEPESGSTFYIELPGLVRISQQAEKRGMHPVENINIHGKSILIIEEEKSNFILLKSYLAGTGVKLIWVNDYQSAVDKIAASHFNLIVIDIRLNGYQLLNYIKQLKIETPLIAQTAYATAEDQKRLSKAGFNDYLIKPFTKETLINKLARFAD
jgi:signal transduction histidine kinase/ligand-binding sensor domain-containing protein/CheY-like chemotaxis protein